MKLFRIWLLVLLAALIPIRGAMAAAMLCQPAVGSHSHEHAAGHEAEHDHAAMLAHDSGGAAESHHADGHGDKCSLCASCCSTVPLISAIPGLPESSAAPQVFQDLGVPAASYLSDAQDRPPRII